MKYLFQNGDIGIRKMEDNITDYKLMTKWLSTEELLDYYEGHSNSFNFIDPQTWNKRAIRCYKKSGFIPMVVIKNREMHDGEYKDSLIMSISFEDWKTNNEHIFRL